MLRYESSRGVIIVWRQSEEQIAPTGTARRVKRFAVVTRGARTIVFNRVPTAGGSGVTGTASITNANDTSSAVGTTTILGILATTNTNDTISATGTTTIVGTSSSTNQNDTVSASGSVGGPVTGTAAITNNNDTCVAYGIVGTPPTANTRLPLTGAGT